MRVCACVRVCVFVYDISIQRKAYVQEKLIVEIAW